MRHIGKGLHAPFQSLGPHLIEHKRQNNRHWKSEYQGRKTDGHGISDQPPKITAREKVNKMFEANEWTAQDSKARIIVLKCHKHAIYRNIVKDKIIYDYRNNQ